MSERRGGEKLVVRECTLSEKKRKEKNIGEIYARNGGKDEERKGGRDSFRDSRQKQQRQTCLTENR